MLSAHWTDDLVRLGACSGAIEWSRDYATLADAWAACERGDWMAWLAGRVSGPPMSESRRPLVRVCCGCVRLRLALFETRYPGNFRLRKRIELAERWAGGDDSVTIEELRAADDADYADDAAYVDANAAADDAAAAAYAVSPAYTASTASDASAYVDAYDVAKTRVQCAEIVRKHYPQPPEITE